MIKEKDTLRKSAQIVLNLGANVFGMSLILWVFALGWLAIFLSYEDAPFGFMICVLYPVIVIAGLSISFILYKRKYYRTSILAMFIPLAGVITVVIGFVSIFLYWYF